MKRYSGMYEIYNTTDNGDTIGDPSVYRLEGQSLDEVKDYEHILWQAIEIERRFDNCEILVDALFECDGKYLDHEELWIKTSIVRGNTPSRYIIPNPNNPTIFAIERERSSLKMIV